MQIVFLLWGEELVKHMDLVYYASLFGVRSNMFVDFKANISLTFLNIMWALILLPTFASIIILI